MGVGCDAIWMVWVEGQVASRRHHVGFCFVEYIHTLYYYIVYKRPRSSESGRGTMTGAEEAVGLVMEMSWPETGVEVGRPTSSWLPCVGQAVNNWRSDPTSL